MKTIAKILATAFGSGYAPKAPGTFGTVMGVLLYVLLRYACIEMGYESRFQSILIISTVIVFFVGLWCTKVLEEEWGHDPGKIVIDEVVGVWIALFFVPFTWVNLLIAFALFRFFDILKPLGITAIDNYKTPSSVMLDDVLAGVYSLIMIHGILTLM